MRTLLLATLLLVPSVAVAQSADSSRFVILHGVDTVATEELRRTDTELHGTLAFRTLGEKRASCTSIHERLPMGAAA